MKKYILNYLLSYFFGFFLIFSPQAFAESVLDVTEKDFIIGDKNALMVASRILAYGPEYTCEVMNPNTDEKLTHTFNIADCPFIKLPKDIDGNNFENINIRNGEVRIDYGECS